MSRSTPATYVSLPAELVDVIAFHLRPEDSEWESLHWTELMSASRGIGSLHSCSLVSRQWRTSTLPHLFRSVRYSFRRERDGDAPQDQDFAKDPVRYKTLSMFSGFLRNNASVSAWIKRLRLVYWPSSWTVDTDLEEYPNVCPEDMLDPHPFVCLLELCPGLDELHLESVLMRDTSSPQPIACKPLKHLSLSPSLNFSLKAETAPGDTGGAAVAPLQIFSSVKVLRFTGLAFGGGLAGTAFPNLLEVDSLELKGRGEGIGAVSDALERSHSATTIRNLLVDGLRLAASWGLNERSSELDQLLATIGPTLRTVTCLGIAFNPLEGRPIVPQLSPCTRLRSLCIGAEVKGRYTPWVIHTILELLGIPAVAPLSQLELRLEFRNVISVSTLQNGFGPIDSTLVSLAQTHGLHSIAVECSMDQSWALRDVSHEALIREILPRVDALGKLWVRVKDTRS